ncbi:MAG: L-lactate dehydrogenase, partial [Proteobacteria bacterium]|nr:L-lactate dehydrogenase [Pseudomonadota bacterium]
KGVESALEIIHKELETTMALCGEKSVLNLTKNNLLIPKDFFNNYI